MRMTLRRRNALTGYFFISFRLIGLTIFCLVPLVRNFALSLTDANLTSVREANYKFNGIANYIEAFTVDIEFVPRWKDEGRHGQKDQRDARQSSERYTKSEFAEYLDAYRRAVARQA